MREQSHYFVENPSKCQLVNYKSHKDCPGIDHELLNNNRQDTRVPLTTG